MPTIKFAHITDCHLGSWRSSRLRGLNLKAFEQAIQTSLSEKVDFILITGDFFDVNVPDLDPVKRAVEVLKSVRDQGVDVYLIYGSHDFSPNAVSMIDILHSAGLFIKPTENEVVEEKLRLKFVTDKKTGAKIVGLSGRAKNLDVPYYEIIDTPSLEAEPGFKIFLMHAPIAEVTPEALSFGEGVPISSLPKGFGYYGGGHLHKRLEYTTAEGGKIVYPGPLFGATFTDLEETARGEQRGFYIVTFAGGKLETRFVEVKVADIVYKTIDAENKTAKQTEAQLNSTIDELDPSGKVVLVKITGSLSAGKRSDIDFSKAERSLVSRGVLTQFISRSGLTSHETAELKVVGQTKEEIEFRVLKERIAKFSIDPTVKDLKVREALQAKFVSTKGEQTARSLLRTLKIEKLDNETVADFNSRVMSDSQPYLDPGNLGES